MQRFEQRQTSQDHLVEEKKEEQNPARPLEPIAGRIDLGHLCRKTRDAGWSVCVSDFSKEEFPETSEAAGSIAKALIYCREGFFGFFALLQRRNSSSGVSHNL
jgi:hypothetical protein